MTGIKMKWLAGAVVAGALSFGAPALAQKSDRQLPGQLDENSQRDGRPYQVRTMTLDCAAECGPLPGFGCSEARKRGTILETEGHPNPAAGRALDGRSRKAAADIDAWGQSDDGSAGETLLTLIGCEVERNRDGAVGNDHRPAHRHGGDDTAVRLAKATVAAEA